MKQNLQIKNIDTLSYSGDYYDYMTPQSKQYLKNDDNFFTKPKEEEKAEPGALFDSQQQMVKELNFVPYFKIDQTIRFNTLSAEDQNKEKKITWQDLSKNVLDTQRVSILSPTNQDRKLSNSFLNKSVLKKLNQSQSLNGSLISKQQYIQKYFKDPSKTAQTPKKNNMTSAKDLLSQYTEENTSSLSIDKIKNTKVSSYRRKSLSNNFVYFSNDMESNLRLKNSFWIFTDVEENSSNLSNFNSLPQGADSSKKNNKGVKTFAQRRANQNRTNTYTSSTFTPKNQAKKQMKIIDNIRMRPKSCYCKQCGPESNKNKKIISLPFKTAIQNHIDSSKLGINTGLKCLTFIGKVRRSKYIDTLTFNQQSNQQNNLDNSQIFIGDSMEQNYQQGNKQKKELSYQNSPKYLNPSNTNNYYNAGSNRKLSYLSLNENSQYNQKRLSYISKDQEDSFINEKKDRLSILKFPNLEIVINNDNKNLSREFKQNEEQLLNQSQIIKQPSLQSQTSQSDNDSQQNSQEEQYSQFSQPKINFRQSQLFSTRSQHKTVDKKQRVKQILSMHKQASRVGQITNLALKSENSVNKDIDSQTNQKEDQNQIVYAQTERAPYYKSSTNKINNKNHVDSKSEEKVSQKVISSTKLQPITQGIIGNQNRFQDNSISKKYIQSNDSQNNTKQQLLKESYYPQKMQIPNKQLQQMVYLPLMSLKQNESLTDRTYQSKLTNSIRVQTLVQNEIKNKNFQEDIKSFETIHTQFLNTTSDSFKEPKLIQFKKRIQEKEEQRLMSMSTRIHYKIHLQQQDFQRQQTFAPKLTTSKDFVSRFVSQKKYQNIAFSSKNQQNNKLNKQKKGQIIYLEDDKSQMKVQQINSDKNIYYNATAEKQTPNIKKKASELEQKIKTNQILQQNQQSNNTNPSFDSQNFKSS